MNFQARLTERTQVAPGGPVIAPRAGYYGYRRYGAWPGYAFATAPVVRQYTEGTLNIDLVDRSRNRMV